MRLTTLLLMLAVIQVTAAASEAQKISFQKKDATLLEVLQSIEQQTGYFYVCEAEFLQKAVKVNIAVKKAGIQDVLTAVFRNQPFTYAIHGKTIVVLERAQKAPAFKEETLLSDPKRQGALPPANTTYSNRLLERISLGRVTEKTVRGKVTDDQNEGLPGVNIVIKGTQHGTTTNAEGQYEISVPNENSTLIFSFVGYVSQEVPVGSRTSIDVLLKTDQKALEEVVVVGYGTMKRSDVVGSITKVSGAKLAKLPVTSVAQSMQGMAGGLFISNSSGHPGASPQVLIRGKNSINLSNGPLWVIDGVAMYEGSSELASEGVKPVSAISMLNPNDIESIEVLKDAAATAIYGNRASGGVILVTTKSNSGNLTGLSVNYDGGISSLPFRQNDVFVDGRTWWKMVDEGWANAGNTIEKDPNSIMAVQWIDPVKPNMTKEEASTLNTDHLGALTQTARFHQFGLTANKGFQSGGVMFSLNYRNEEGVLKNNLIERLTGRFGFNFSPVKGVNAGISTNMQFFKNQGVPSGGGKGAGAGALGWANWFGILPWYKLYDPDSQTGYWFPNSGFNSAAAADRNLIRSDSDMYRTISNGFIQWVTPVKGLSVKGELGIDLMITNSSYWKSILMSSQPYQSIATEQSVTKKAFTSNIHANYIMDVGRHSFNFTAGLESLTGDSYLRRAAGSNIYSLYPELINPVQRTEAIGYSSYNPAMLGIFSRINYKFKERYILNASLRRDGHGALSKENRWALFPSVGAGWIISEEAFMKSSVFSHLKLRGSWGQTGNAGLNRSMTRMNWGLSVNRYGTDLLPGGTTLGPMGNEALKWETTTNTDLGIDFGLLNNRISGSIVYYRQKMKDLILQGNVPISTGFESNTLWENVGDMVNRGWELEISSVNLNGPFHWSTDFNISFNSNKITGLNSFEKGKGAEGAKSIRREGEKLDTWYLANFVHIDSEKGIPVMQKRDAEKWNTEFITVPTGELIPMNQFNSNNNKMVQSGKSPLPVFFGGITNNFKLGGFDLNVLLTYAGGHYLINELYTNNIRITAESNLLQDMVGNYWQKPGDQKKFWKLAYDYLQKYDNDGNPSATGTNFNNPNSTYYLERADYVKLRNVQLGYTFPVSVTDRLKVKNLRVYLGGTNLLTLTGFKGLDPETNNQLPVPRIVNFGLSFNL